MRNTREAGTVLPLIAASLAVLMGFGGIAVDVGYLEYRQQAQQVATDAAAAGGAEALLRVGCPSQGAAMTSAALDATDNGFVNNTNGVSITTLNPPTNGPFASNLCAVQVTITDSKVGTFFTRLFGYSGGETETTQAVAIVSQTGGGCIYLLSPSVSSNFNGDNVTAKKCGVLINDSANFNGATIDVMNLGYAGSAPNTNGATFKNALPAPMLPVADPCPEISGCASLTASPPTVSGCQNFNGNGYHGTLSPGCYSNLNLNGATVTLNPGLYIFNGGTNFNGASISGSGVTMYVTQGGTPPNFNGIANASLAPCSSSCSNGAVSGVLYYQVPANSQAVNLNGSSETFSGLIYAPTPTTVNFNGANGGYLVLVFGAANFNGSVAQDFATPPPYSSLVKQAVVAE